MTDWKRFVGVVAIVAVMTVYLAFVVCAAGAQLRGGVSTTDVYSADSREPASTICQAALGLRKDAADGTGAPQIGVSPTYPPTLPAWNTAKTRFPSDAARYQPCVNPLLQAIDAIKDAGRLMSGLPQTLARVNAGVQKATELIKGADICLNALMPPAAAAEPNSSGRGDSSGRGALPAGSMHLANRGGRRLDDRLRSIASPAHGRSCRKRARCGDPSTSDRHYPECRKGQSA